jgi:hypothetical protein
MGQGKVELVVDGSHGEGGDARAGGNGAQLVHQLLLLALLAAQGCLGCQGAEGLGRLRLLRGGGGGVVGVAWCARHAAAPDHGHQEMGLP